MSEWRAWAAVLMPGAIVLLVVMLVVRRLDVEAGRRAVAEANAQAAQARADSLSDSLRVLVRRFRIDTVTLTRWRTRVDTVAAVALRDTVVLHDTTYVPLAPVRRLLVATDSERAACSEALGTCAAISVAKDGIHRADSVRIAALERARPGLLHQAFDRLLWGAIGFSTCAVTR